jgi:hypothetical protein
MPSSPEGREGRDDAEDQSVHVGNEHHGALVPKPDQRQKDQKDQRTKGQKDQRSSDDRVERRAKLEKEIDPFHEPIETIPFKQSPQDKERETTGLQGEWEILVI